MANNISRSMTRRSAIRNAGKVAAFASLPLTAPPASAQSIYGKRQATAFALAGDRYHNIDYVRTALGKTLGRSRMHFNLEQAVRSFQEQSV